MLYILFKLFKRLIASVVIMLTLSGCIHTARSPFAQDLLSCKKTFAVEQEFVSPSSEYRVATYYHWQNGHIGRESIKKDLESMKDVGIGSFYLFNTAEGVPAGPVPYMSKEWWKMYRYLSREAARQGLEMGVMNGAGWGVSGGPWVQPEDAMQEVVWTALCGPLRFDGKLKEPTPCVGLERDFQRNPVRNRRYFVPRDFLAGHYHDIAVLAFPTPEGEIRGEPYQISGLKAKTGHSLMSVWNIDENEAPEADIVHPENIIDLTHKMREDGGLEWDVPDGRWTIVRIGYQPTGKQNHPSPVEGRGLEVDKLSSKALDRYWKESTLKLMKGAPKLSGVLIDSYEAGYQNWTPGFEENFKKRMGYDPGHWLLTLTGRVVGGTRDTERFLWDYRKVISELLQENYYNHFADLCHSNGVEFAIEPYGQFGNIDELSNGELADILVGEFQAGEKPRSFTRYTVKLASSLSHIYGKEVVGAEAFTNSGRIFTLSPASLKTQTDYYFCQGMNQVWLHSFVHDPYEKAPGLTLGTYGGHFNRRNTWWKYSKPWFDYLSRCQYMLRQGRSKNDILYYMGEDAPARPPRTEDLEPSLPAGYDYDVCGGSRILSLLNAGEGVVTAPSGSEYRLLVVRPQKYMRLHILQRILSLAGAGAIVYMEPPQGTPGFDSDEAALKQLVNTVWGEKSNGAINYGKGKIYSSDSLEDILKDNDVMPDLMVENGEGKVLFTHRTDGDGNIFFVCNQMPKTDVAPVLTFNIKGKRPEIWDPKDGSIRSAKEFELAEDGRIRVRLQLEASGSAFVVFKKAIGSVPGITPARDPGQRDTLLLENDWQVSLLPGLSREGMHFRTDSLFNLSASLDPRIKYHSGEILYSNNFKVEDTTSRRFVLDLGEVAVLAKLRVNGIDAGTLWCEPFRADISAFLHPGENGLEVKVVNLLYNQLAGDLLLPEDCEWTTETGSTASGYSLYKIPQWVVDGKDSPTGRRTFVTWRWPFMKDKGLPASGLEGPVRIVTEAL